MAAANAAIPPMSALSKEYTVDLDLHGRRILVTGAGKGIGRELCIFLTLHGAKVVALSRTESDLISLQKEIGCEIITCDLRNEQEVKTVLEKAGQFYGLVNNAGISKLAPFLEASLEDFDAVMNVNVRSVFQVSQIVARKMKGGAIVNISSQASTRAFKDHTAYCTSKGALDQLTRMMALELGPLGIRVNAVNPTVVLTDMGAMAWSDEAKSAPVKARIPLRGRFATTGDVVRCVSFLLSDYSHCVHGVTLPIDGGFLIT